MDDPHLATEQRPALVVAHPGHELRVHGWMQKHRPVVHVLTDGSGRSGRSRIGRTRGVLEAIGATPGEIFSRFSDRELYEQVLRANHPLFVSLSLELAASFVRQEATFVLGDAEECAFMTHDLFRGIRIAAVRAAEQVIGRTIHHYEFIVDGDPRELPPSVARSAIDASLDDVSFARKLAASRQYEELRELAQQMLDQYGEAAFRRERIFPLAPSQAPKLAGDGSLPYEEHGKRLVEQRAYAKVVTFDRHVAPALAAVSRAVPAMVEKLMVRHETGDIVPSA